MIIGKMMTPTCVVEYVCGAVSCTHEKCTFKQASSQADRQACSRGEQLNKHVKIFTLRPNQSDINFHFLQWPRQTGETERRPCLYRGEGTESMAGHWAVSLFVNTDTHTSSRAPTNRDSASRLFVPRVSRRVMCGVFWSPSGCALPCLLPALADARTSRAGLPVFRFAACNVW